MRLVLQWILSRGVLYLALVLAILIGPILWQATLGGDWRGELMSPGDVASEFQIRKRAAAKAAAARTQAIGGYSAAAMEARLSAARAELAVVNAELERRQDWFSALRPRKILERKQFELRRAALEGEVRVLEAARRPQILRAELSVAVEPTLGAIAGARHICDRANLEVRQFNARAQADRTLRATFADEAERLTRNARVQCDRHNRLVAARNAAFRRREELQRELTRAEATLQQARTAAADEIDAVGIHLAPTLRSVLAQAGVILVGILVTPYVIRLLFYFVLAPLAARRPAVRLSTPRGGEWATPSVAQPAAASAAIRLQARQVLLVRQGYLQSTSGAGAKATRALLDWRHPVSSLASGLVFLTRITGEGGTTTVSAVHDPLAEVAVLALPGGAACVLQPRALVAVVQPDGRPIRITSHWRLGSLHAWLSLQLRYLMFHGPAQLVIKGGRGVRVERAEQGRVFGQDQLVGFSPDLAYAVTRTETFWPYFFGLQPLLKDEVRAGSGIVVIEEAPLSAGGRAARRRGLEGAADVVLKAVGL